MPKLIIHHADGSQVKYGLNGKVFTVGRAENNDIVLAGGSASNYHAVLKVADSGDFTVTDLESTNHTRVNGRTVQNSPLRDGDTVLFGDTMAIYESEFAPAPATDEQPTQIYETAPPPAPAAPRSTVAVQPRAGSGLPPQGPGAPRPAFTPARPAAAGSSNYYSATDGCFAMAMVLFFGMLAFAGGVWVRHSHDHAGQSFATYIKDVMADRAKAQQATVEK